MIEVPRIPASKIIRANQRTWARFWPPLNQGRAARRCLQDVVHIVCDATRQLSQCLHSFGVGRTYLSRFPGSYFLPNSAFEMLVQPDQFQPRLSKCRHVRQALQPATAGRSHHAGVPFVRPLSGGIHRYDAAPGRGTASDFDQDRFKLLPRNGIFDPPISHELRDQRPPGSSNRRGPRNLSTKTGSPQPYANHDGCQV